MRIRAWLPLLSFVIQIGLVFLAALWIDSSDLHQPADSWGYAAGVFILAVIYLTIPLAVVVACTITGVIATKVTTTRRATIVGTVVASLAGSGGIVLGGWVALDSGREADTVFGVALAVASMVALLPLAVAVRRPSAA